MIDPKLYCETFSRLRASEEAKKEVLQMKEKKRVRMPKVLRGAAIAAAMAMALAVTAGAVNLATDGELFRYFTVVWAGEDSLLAVDGQGNQVEVTMVPEGQVTVEDGRMILHAQGEETDITDEIEATGSYHFAYDMTVVHDDGSEEVRTITIDITGGPDQWTLTQDNGDGTQYTTSGPDGEEPAVPESGTADSATKSAAVAGD